RPGAGAPVCRGRQIDPRVIPKGRTKMYLEKFKLAGKTAVVTGGGQGIGLASVEALAEAGAKVVIADRDAKVAAQGQTSLKAKGYDVEIVDMDVTKSAQVALVAAQLTK